MNKLIVLVLGLLLLSLTAVAQEATASTESGVKKCIPTKECAAKMGMTIAECKAVCKKLCKASTASEASAETSVASAASEASIESESIVKDKKACSASKAQCAKMKGLSVAESKATSKSGQNTAHVSEAGTQVASSSVAATVESKSIDTKTNCVKGKKACCKK